ncbi:hypothetical protein GQ42DRAFT_162728 [Ramicandelaber brevisporus]|nr:hypothetical protein GQ42DRAFT_162728 [Ramicandelaber brevisporus]
MTLKSRTERRALLDQRRFATLRRKENAHTQTLRSRAGPTSERHVRNYPRSDFHTTPNSIVVSFDSPLSMYSSTSESSISRVSFLSATTTATVPRITTTILSRVWLFLCLIPFLPLRPSALSLNRTVSFLLATLSPSLCTAPAASVVYATSVLTSRRHPFSPAVPSSSPVHAWLLLVARAASFKVVWSPPIADLAQLCLHPFGSAVYSPGRTFRPYKGSRLSVCLVQTTGLIRTRPNVTIRSNLAIWS